MSWKKRQTGALTEMERRILGAFALGLGHKETGKHLGISHRTVSLHSENAARKLGMQSRNQKHAAHGVQMLLAAYGTTQSLAGVVEWLRRTQP